MLFFVRLLFDVSFCPTDRPWMISVPTLPYVYPRIRIKRSRPSLFPFWVSEERGKEWKGSAPQTWTGLLLVSEGTFLPIISMEVQGRILLPPSLSPWISCLDLFFPRVIFVIQRVSNNSSRRTVYVLSLSPTKDLITRTTVTFVKQTCQGGTLIIYPVYNSLIYQTEVVTILWGRSLS